MKPIIVSDKNKDRLQAALEAAQAQAKVRLVTADDLLATAADLSSRIVDKWQVPKVDLEGTYADIDIHAMNFPNAYRGRPESTHCTLLYSKGSWRLRRVERYYTRRAGHEVHLRLSDSAKEALLYNAGLVKF